MIEMKPEGRKKKSKRKLCPCCPTQSAKKLRLLQTVTLPVTASATQPSSSTSTAPFSPVTDNSLDNNSFASVGHSSTYSGQVPDLVTTATPTLTTVPNSTITTNSIHLDDIASNSNTGTQHYTNPVNLQLGSGYLPPLPTHHRGHRNRQKQSHGSNMFPHVQMPQVVSHVHNVPLMSSSNVPQVHGVSNDSSSDSESSSDDDFNFNDIVANHANNIMAPHSGRKIPSNGPSYGQRSDKCARRVAHYQLNHAVYELLKSSLAPSTYTSYKNALKHYKRFHESYYLASPLLPVSTEQLAQFIAVCHYRNLKATTITSYCSAISYIHRLYNLPVPSESFLVKTLLRGLRRQRLSDKRRPFTVATLNLLLRALKRQVSDRYIQV